jgi:hypothetical protein
LGLRIFVFHSKHELALEVMALRHQIAILKRRTRSPTLRLWDRCLWMAPPPPEPKLHRFRVTVRCTAIGEVIREEEAQSAKQAREEALKEVADGQIDLSKAEVTRRVARVEKQ